MTYHHQEPNARLIATCAPESAAIALNELARIDASVRLLAWLDDGVALLTAADAVALAEQCAMVPPVFVRHLAPAAQTISLTGQRDDIARIATAVEQTYAAWMPAEHTGGVRCDAYAVQVRVSQQADHPYTRYAVAEPLRDLLSRSGTENVRQPAWVLSVYCAATTAYAGLWPVARCLSSWPGGARRFARTPAQVSRAEFKLLEALEVFALTLPDNGRVLDLGAAPGGWTRLLVERGFAVLAVDPAALDPRVAALPLVQHWHGHAEQFIATSPDQFDVIVNDMRMDARDSARLMVQAVDRLRWEGVALMTLKLPHTDSTQVYRQARRILEQVYTVVGARQLFHNRSEVTLALVRNTHAG